MRKGMPSVPGPLRLPRAAALAGVLADGLVAVPLGSGTASAAPTTTVARHERRTGDQLGLAVRGPVGELWSQQSGGAIRLGVTAPVDWSPVPVDCKHPDQVWVSAAEVAHFTEGPGKHLVVYLGTPAG